MEILRKYIRKELKILKERIVKVPLPNDAKKTLFQDLNLKKSHIRNIRAIKSIKPSYKIFLNNNQSFTISDLGDGFGFGKVKINSKEYDILDNKQLPLALNALNDLQTKPIINPTGDEEGSGEDTGGGDTGGGDTGGDETEEPAEEPAEEPEA